MADKMIALTVGILFMLMIPFTCAGLFFFYRYVSFDVVPYTASAVSFVLIEAMIGTACLMGVLE